MEYINEEIFKMRDMIDKDINIKKGDKCFCLFILEDLKDIYLAKNFLIIMSKRFITDDLKAKEYEENIIRDFNYMILDFEIKEKIGFMTINFETLNSSFTFREYASRVFIGLSSRFNLLDRHGDYCNNGETLRYMIKKYKDNICGNNIISCI